MIGEAALMLQAVAVQGAAAETAAGPFAAASAVPDDVLAQQRGGIRLPGGIDVSLSIDTVTALDGRVVLQTVTRIAEGAPVVTAYAPAGGETVDLPAQGDTAAGPQAGSYSGPSLSYDRQNGFSITVQRPAPQIEPAAANGQTPTAIAGLHPVDLTEAVATPNGVIHSIVGERVSGVELQGADIRIMHLTGSALGSAILNTGSERAIDTRTTLSIELGNVGPNVLGSAMLRVEDVSLGIMRSRI